MATLIIRNVNKKMIHEFKTKATKEGMKMGEAITMAMNLWITKEMKRKRKSILELHPIDMGDPNLSQNIDEALYG